MLFLINRRQALLSGTWQLQWGSEYRTSLGFKWSKVVRKSNRLLFKWLSEYQTILVCYSNGDLNSRQFVHYFLTW